jgi:EAL domain-containing protein (putative c-di-GMP-specific phosphodiesterase class I)
LLAHADVALYRAKNSGKACYALFDEPARAEERESSSLQAGLRKALEDGQLCLFYQPEVDLGTGRIRSMEALLRWQHPERGLIEAGELFPLVRQAGLGRVISRWVHREVCSQASHWFANGIVDAQTQVTINLSEEDLQCEELAAELETSLLAAGLAPQHLRLECPEAVLIENTGLALRRMHALRKLGLGLAIDSFGARFGSLRLLEYLPIQSLKVDRSLVDGSMGNPAILRAVCSIARDLQVSVTAKCIETVQQHQTAVQARCDCGQGNLFSPPVNLDEMTHLLQRRPRLSPGSR